MAGWPYLFCRKIGNKQRAIKTLGAVPTLENAIRMPKERDVETEEVGRMNLGKFILL